MSQFRSAGGLAFGNGPPVGPPPMAAVTLLDLADPARADHRHGQQEDPVVVAPLLGADLDDPARLLGDLADLLALVDRQGQRLLAVDVLARPHGVDEILVCQWSGVPMMTASISLRSRSLR